LQKQVPELLFFAVVAVHLAVSVHLADELVLVAHDDQTLSQSVMCDEALP
jgi:hypothetical protein